MENRELSIVVVGASGSLANSKIIPAFFALFSQGRLPENFSIFGFARSGMSDDEFRERIADNLTCRYVPGEDCTRLTEQFLSRCFYQSGRYDSSDSFLDLYGKMQKFEKNSKDANRLFYFAIPPSVFGDVARSLGGAGLVTCGDEGPWSRTVIEKPFGRDRQSSDRLINTIGEVFKEDQTFRIDHYLGKEVIQNLMVLRFANSIFEPIWNNDHIQRVEVEWKEDSGVESRIGYFEKYGIIRDVMQNHLMQILSLLAMEPPGRMEPGQIRDRKVSVLREIAPPSLDRVVTGQYVAGRSGKEGREGYREHDSVPGDSRTPTFAAARLEIDNDRWRGVPFFLCAGKGLEEKCNRVRVVFRSVEKNIFCQKPQCLPPDELIIQIQPDESLVLKIMNKEPGLRLNLVESGLDLRYSSAFDKPIPDAYERLLLDVIEGDKSLFIRADELAAAWDIYTPLLHELEKQEVEPEPYPFGSTGPDAWKRLCPAAKTPVQKKKGNQQNDG
jgi:glucose-6-phosphate 1-dehydrogenase